MKPMQWTTADKSQWPRGEWDNEPDKMQWRDDETGYPCLIVRNHSGALCGYVGAPEGHPLHGESYSGTAKLPKELLAQMLEARAVADLYADDLEKNEVHIESILDAHGGITFADSCASHGRDVWEKWRSKRAEWEAEAAVHPQGDSAQRLREWAGTFDNYEAWLQHVQAVSVCHLPSPDEADSVWWFGFDCAHAGDFSPAYENVLGRLGRETGWGTVVEYRNVDYVREQCKSLARQLADAAASSRTSETVEHDGGTN